MGVARSFQRTAVFGEATVYENLLFARHGLSSHSVLGRIFRSKAWRRDREAFRSLWLVAIMLIGFGLLLGLADYLGRRTRELTDLTYPHGLWYGLAQMLALIPGVSRSGATTNEICSSVESLISSSVAIVRGVG